MAQKAFFSFKVNMLYDYLEHGNGAGGEMPMDSPGG